MSLLNRVFVNQTTDTEEQVVPPVQETTKDDMIKKYQYNFDKSSMQNAFNEIASRFSGNCQVPSINRFFSEYINSVKTSGYGLDHNFKMNSYKNLFFKRKQYFPFYSDLYLRGDRLNGDFPKTDGKFYYQHKIVRGELLKACPNYYEVQTDPKQSETCYLSALDYWKAVTNGYFATLSDNDRRRYYTNLDQSDRSKFLREHLFNKQNIRYPSI
jgi:hypothetical protein